VKAFNHDTVIAYGHYGLVPAILYSANGGNNFKLVFHSQYDPLQLRTGITDMVFPQNTNIGYAVDADRILKTTDKGLTWQTSRTEAGAYFNNLEATDNNTIFAIRSAQPSGVRKTFNGGDAWSVLNLPAGTVKYVSFLNYDKGWINMNNANGGSLYYTINSGQSWTLKTNDQVEPFLCEKMKFINDSTGLAIVYQYKTYKTTDSGRVWQQLPRDNNYSYLGYDHYDLHIRNIDQFWSGGGHGFLELTNNGGGTPIPAALFRVDTTNLFQTNSVQLINYSKPGNQYAWYVNSVFISNSYNTSYTHDLYMATDTVMLIVSNGTYSDTAYKYLQFNALPYPPPQVISFTPTSGGPGTVVTITGNFFVNASAVKFGGIPASAFTLNSIHQITAVVGEGANGAVSVTTPKGTGLLPGFITYPPPVITSFSPMSGPIGTVVTINGNNFNSTSSNNIVYFGSVKAQVITGSANQLTVAVPVGATYEPITVTINKHIAYSNLRFNVTFPSTCNFSGYTFEPGKTFNIGNSSNDYGHMAIGDIDGDGKSDIVTSTWYGISILRNTSTPGLVNYAPGVIFTSTEITTPLVTGVAIEDIDGDGKKDIAVTNSNANTVSIFKNTSTIGSISLATKIDYPTLNGPTHIIFNDLDNDGKSDMIITNEAPNVNKISIFRNISLNGSIAFEPKIDIATGVYEGRVCPGDLNGDGKADLVIADGFFPVPSGGQWSFRVYKNTSGIGTISFANVQTIPHYFLGSPTDARLFDANGDGKLDLFMAYDVSGASSPQGSAALYRNTSTIDSISFALPYSTFPHSLNLSVVVGDLDGDAKADLFTTNGMIKNLSTPLKDSLLVVSDIYGIVGGGKYSAIADIDGDSKPDVITGPFPAVFRNKLNERGAWAGKDTTLCNGQFIKLGIDSAWGGFTYNWTSNPVGFTSTFARPTVSPAVSTTYYVAVTNLQGCIMYDTITVTLGGPAPVANAGPDASICLGNSIQLGTAATGSNTYLWTSNPAGFNSTLANPVITPTAGSTTYYLSVNSGTCIAKDTVLITGWNYPTANAGPDKAICAGSSTTIGTADNFFNTLSNWTSNPPGFTSMAQTPVVNPAVTTSYFLQVTNTANCISRDTVVITVNPQPAMPVVSASGPLTFCSGGSVTLTSSVSPNYQWYKNGVQISGATNQMLVVTESGDYKVSTVIGFCPASSLLTTVTVNSSTLPTIIAGGPLSFCQGLSVFLVSS
ncbi:MAG TPA: FG-GAP-like repeat-containing protein, partial [Chitinophagaceae bacterium]|nr:FG-GAP-like repeat-containing protein [Chitinophagaceae bacterium]